MTETQGNGGTRGKWSPNESETFSVAMNADGHCLSTAARFVRKEMCEAWAAIDTERHELETRMAEVGIVEPLHPKAGVLRLNIGGARVHVGHSILRRGGEEESSPSRLSDLLESVWDDRIPRDSGGYIVIDESPACTKHLIHQLLKRSSTAMGMSGLSFDGILPSDEKAHMPHVCSVLGLTENTHVDDSASAVPLDEYINMRWPKAREARPAIRVFRTREAAVPPTRTNLERKSTLWGASLLDHSAPDPAAMSAESYHDDIRSFGVSIADYLMEERVALHQARVELEKTRAKAAASADALSALYGEDVAANAEGVAAVADLNVCGTRMTTLRSTLQACPNSAFAARFDEDKWPPSEKDMDKQGRRVIDDCSPSVFSKVLDVLRMRKREAWAAEGESNRSDVRVVVKAADRESFEAFVHMYFTDQESFVMDLVQKSDEANDNSVFGGRRASRYVADDDGALSRRRAVRLQGSNARARRSSKW